MGRKRKSKPSKKAKETIVCEMAPRTEPRADATTLPVKDTILDEEPEVEGKTEEEKIMDKIWAEMKFYHEAGEVGPAASQEKTEITGATPCQQGKHDLILDEEVGYICRVCYHVHQEIRDVFLPESSSDEDPSKRKRSR